MRKSSSALYVWLIVVIIGLFSLLEWRPWLKPEKNTVESLPIQVNPAQLASPSKQGELPVQLVGGKPESSRQIIRAQLSPVQFTTIVSEMNGKISKLPLREGESFAENQLLVSFDCGLQEAQLQKIQAQLQIAERKYDTNRRLLERGSVSKVETENSASELEKVRAEVKELTILVSKCHIEAPYKGKVVEQKVRAQQFVQAGQPVMEILDNSMMELEFIAPSVWMSRIKVGDQLQIRIDETGKSYPAKITRIGAKIDSVSQTVKIAAVIDGEFIELSPGMSGTITIDVYFKKL
jgi:RND family efflux transporter MFP subunit